MAAFAYTVLFSWPLVSIWAFKKWRPEIALLVTIIGAYMFLPLKTSVDLPLLPDLTKYSVPALVAVFLAISVKDNLPKGNRFVPVGLVPQVLLVILFLGTFFTVLFNGEPLFYDWRYIPGMRLYDAFSFILSSLLLLLPLFLGHRILATPNAQTTFLKFMVFAALFYSLLALFEVRMSPQLHKIFYGQYPHEFLQTYREGGFRPTIFIGHGLTVALFFALSTLCALGLWKYGAKEKKNFYLVSAIWLFFILILRKSLGPFLLTILGGIIMLIGNQRINLLFAATIAAIALTYPALRTANFIPTNSIVNLVENINPERADSLEFRLHHEDALLARAQLKPVFGWGGYGRNRIFNENGKDVSVVDGYWVLTFGLGGWIRYIALYGLICMPLIFAAVRRKRLELGPETTIVSVLLAVNLIDLIPNASLTPVTLLMVGAIWGRLSFQDNTLPENQNVVVDDTSRAQRVGYTRYARKIDYGRPHLRQLSDK